MPALQIPLRALPRQRFCDCTHQALDTDTRTGLAHARAYSLYPNSRSGSDHWLCGWSVPHAVWDVPPCLFGPIVRASSVSGRTWPRMPDTNLHRLTEARSARAAGLRIAPDYTDTRSLSLPAH